jgi:hypothetical protein
VFPSARGFKVADNESPEPRDRVYFSFNYFDNLFSSANRSTGAGVHNVLAFRETFGLEKTCLEGAASVGLRLPLNTLSADSAPTGVSGSSTDVGDLSVLLKALLYRSEDGRQLVSAGLAVTAPSGPGSFAGAGGGRFWDTTLQPFVGYLCGRSDFFVQGFAAVDVPTDAHDVTLLFNDVGVGYFLYRVPGRERLVTAVVPTLEAHVNTPLNHRGGLDLRDPARAPDLVDLTAGLNVELLGRTRLAVGVVTPLAGPKPFDVEVVAQLRCGF